VPTTRDLALAVLATDAFRSGDYTTAFLAEAGDGLGLAAA
jgi:hypothetical protein